jgi:hypothetical protein
MRPYRASATPVTEAGAGFAERKKLNNEKALFLRIAFREFGHERHVGPKS